MNIEDFKLKYQKKEVWEKSNSVSTNPVVSVCVQTYQHFEFIGECLDGILMQKTNFDFEIILGEDNSSDGTRDICIKYAEKYPDKIRLFLHHRENNISIAGTPTGRFVLMTNLFSSKGKYLALCEGDDYWTDPYKLQKQVDFLEANLSCIGYCHNFKIVDAKNEMLEESLSNYQDKYYIDTFDIIKDASVATLTVVFRNIFKLNPLPSEIMKAGNGDKVLFSWLSTFGYFYSDKKWISAAYRKHPGGLWSMKLGINRGKLSILTHEVILSILPYKYSGSVGRKLAGKRAILAVMTYRSNTMNINEFIKAYLVAIKTCFRFKAFKVFISLHKKLVFK